MAALWWKFSLGPSGTHLFRVQNPGGVDQSVWLDGDALEAPPGTLLYTGPAGSLLELQNTDVGWILLVDGTPVESYLPGAGDTSPSQHGQSGVTWFRFTLPRAGTHHLRVTNIGSPLQEVCLDAVPLEAPPGTMTFTGPAASLLELQRRDGAWVLVADGMVCHSHDPNTDESDPVHVFNFTLPATGLHRLSVGHIGKSGQELELDGMALSAPAGTTTFTGPEASLLQLVQDQGRWILYVDGMPCEASTNAGDQAEHCWTFIAPQTGTAHLLYVAAMGRPGQVVSVDGIVMPAPEGSTMFTGPGGCLLELKPLGHAWSLFVDGEQVEDDATAPACGAFQAEASSMPPSSRSAVAEVGSLPQGVSHDAVTGKFKANIKIGKQYRHLGDFSTPEEAHAAYLKAKG